jgi:hypothetical protein
MSIQTYRRKFMTHQDALTQCLALAITAPDDRVDAAVALSMELAELCTPFEVARAKKTVEGQVARGEIR